MGRFSVLCSTVLLGGSPPQALESGDATARAEVTAKLDQLETKRAQLIAVITQLKRHRIQRMTEQGLGEGD